MRRERDRFEEVLEAACADMEAGRQGNGEIAAAVRAALANGAARPKRERPRGRFGILMPVTIEPGEAAKRCPRCGRTLSLMRAFGISRCKRDGRQSYCYECMRAEARAYRRARQTGI